MNNPKIGKKPTGDVKPGRILIVDDEPDFREMLDLMLRKEGFETAIAENGEDFLNKIDDFQPDLVTLDVMMPGLTTEEILEKIIKKKCKPKIILLTVVRYSEEALEEILKKSNIVAYIDKPFDLDDFIDTVNGLLQTNKFRR
ncbi:MAG: response regulator [Thermoplasmata archaeon]|nr:response regulator [Thermoplasmata archaeon]MBE3136569.1 response regulator [Thermoplasmata archaeon]